MNGLTNFFTFIFNAGKKTEKVKKEIETYFNSLGLWTRADFVELATLKFSKYIYKKNGEYRRGGKELVNYIICLCPAGHYYDFVE